MSVSISTADRCDTEYKFRTFGLQTCLHSSRLSDVTTNAKVGAPATTHLMSQQIQLLELLLKLLNPLTAIAG